MTKTPIIIFIKQLMKTIISEQMYPIQQTSESQKRPQKGNLVSWRWKGRSCRQQGS